MDPAQTNQPPVINPSPQVNQAPPPTPVIVESTKPKSSFIKIIILIIIVLVIGIILGKYFNIDKLLMPPQPSPTPIASPIPTLDPTAGWKTYKSTDFNFEIKYPPKVIVVNEQNKEDYKSVAFKGGGLNFEVMLRPSTGMTSMESYYYMDFKYSRKTTLAGLPAYVYEMPNGYCDGPSCSEPSLTIVADEANYLYHLGFFGDIAISDEENLILSTFNFLDKKVSNKNSISRDKLIGIWQASPVLAAGWVNRYHFFPSGKFVYFKSEMDCTNRNYSHEGTWTIDEQSLNLKVTQETKLVGGSVVDSYGSCADGQTLEGTQRETISLTNPTLSILSLKSCTNPKVTHYDCMELNNVEYYKYSIDPFNIKF